MRSVATKLLLMTLLPSLAAGSIGLWVLYGLTDRTVRDATRRDSVQIADLISTSFNFTHKTDGSLPKEAHPAVTALMRMNSQIEISSILPSVGVPTLVVAADTV